jgi:hypothetical protein
MGRSEMEGALRKRSYVLHSLVVCTENLNSDVVMVKPAEDRV